MVDQRQPGSRRGPKLMSAHPHGVRRRPRSRVCTGLRTASYLPEGATVGCWAPTLHSD